MKPDYNKHEGGLIALTIFVVLSGPLHMSYAWMLKTTAWVWLYILIQFLYGRYKVVRRD